MRNSKILKPDNIHKINRRTLITHAAAITGAGLMGSAFTGSASIFPDQGGETVFNIKKYGASGIRQENATKPVRDAVEACMAAGGGTIYVPPGEYTVGTIQLRNNVSLHLEAGATFYLSQNQNDFIPGVRAMIYANSAENISLTGRGTLNGLAQHEFIEMKGMDPEIATEIEIARKAGMDMRRYYVTGMASFMCIFNNCLNVSINGISLLRSPLWNIRLNNCDRVFIKGIYISSDLEKGVTSDGIDVCSSKNVTISDSIISTGDDCIVLKTPLQRGQDVAGTTENVVVTNCILTSSSTALKIGTETHADIRHVVFNNCTIRNSNKGFGIDVRDGGTVSNVIFSNLTIDTNRRHWNWWGSAETFKIILKKRRDTSRLGKIKNIVIENIVSHVRGTSSIKGTPEQHVENVRINDMQIFMNPEDAIDKRATHALQMEYINGIKIRDSKVNWREDETEPKWQGALFLKNVNEFEIRSFMGRQGLKNSSMPAIFLDNVTGGMIAESHATAGCSTFIHLKGQKSEDILLRNNSIKRTENYITYENENLKDKIVKI